MAQDPPTDTGGRVSTLGEIFPIDTNMMGVFVSVFLSKERTECSLRVIKVVEYLLVLS
jgi:hypothetical protein